MLLRPQRGDGEKASSLSPVCSLAETYPRQEKHGIVKGSVVDGGHDTMTAASLSSAVAGDAPSAVKACTAPSAAEAAERASEYEALVQDKLPDLVQQLSEPLPKPPSTEPQPPDSLPDGASLRAVETLFVLSSRFCWSHAFECCLCSEHTQKHGHLQGCSRQARQSERVGPGLQGGARLGPEGLRYRWRNHARVSAHSEHDHFKTIFLAELRFHTDSATFQVSDGEPQKQRIDAARRLAKTLALQLRTAEAKIVDPEVGDQDRDDARAEQERLLKLACSCP